MELLNEGVVEDEASRYPGKLLWTVALPIKEILVPMAHRVEVQNPPNSIYQPSVDDLGQWGGGGPAVKQCKVCEMWNMR